ncbi:MAG TPA: helix-turn-helix domain-containing protein [Terriglobia bacterium]|nr:helix-turn-helix domain-containing protein [Terriglobia bacterium]
MKNNDKNQSPSDSYSVSEAATLLGVSIPTLKRMVTDGTLDGFRTPGGHLRISAASIDAIKNQRQTRARSVREASPVLQNRRERLEELNIETQEMRARRELAKLQREEQEEAERREAEAQTREEEAAQRQAEIELEQERLAREEAQERRRLERERLQEQQRREAENKLAAFHQRWYDAAAEAVITAKLAWLTPSQRKELGEALEAEIDRRQPADEPRMGAIIVRSLEALVEPLRAERDAQERRQKLTKEALWSLPYSATEADKVKAAEAITEALGRLDTFADVCKMRVAAQEAVRPFRQAIEKRDLDARLINWALQSLPWSRTEGDMARIRRESAEILAEFPPDVSEPEGREALQPTVTEACTEINNRQAEKERQARKVQLVGEGLAEINTHMLELLREDEITRDEYLDSDFTRRLETAVRRGLESELTGDESTKAARKVARGIIDGELE